MTDNKLNLLRPLEPGVNYTKVKTLANSQLIIGRDGINPVHITDNGTYIALEGYAIVPLELYFEHPWLRWKRVKRYLKWWFGVLRNDR